MFPTHVLSIVTLMLGSTLWAVDAPKPPSADVEILKPAIESGEGPYLSTDMTVSAQHETDGVPFQRIERRDGSTEEWGWACFAHPEQNWSTATGLLFKIRGTGTGRSWGLDIYAGIKPREIFHAELTDSQPDWHEVYVPFTDFQRKADEQQEPNAPHDGLNLVRMSGFGLITASGPARLDIADIKTTTR
jgi:Carbohydrate binding domain (family 11)